MATIGERKKRSSEMIEMYEALIRDSKDKIKAGLYMVAVLLVGACVMKVLGGGIVIVIILVVTALLFMLLVLSLFGRRAKIRREQREWSIRLDELNILTE